MRFPEWVDDPKLPDNERAASRLRFMMLELVLTKSSKSTLREFARIIESDHSTVCYSINRGSCTEQLAEKIQSVFGEDRAPKNNFINPLGVV